MLRPPPISEISFPDEEALLDKEALLAINLFIKKTGERKVDVESLKKLEYSQKQEKAEELTQEIDYIKTQTQKLFGELRNKIKQLIPQIIAQTKKEEITAEALKELSIKIPEIITKIEEEYSKKPEEFAQDKNPIEGIITKILEGDTEVDQQFKQLFRDDPDSIKKILTQILKENAIKKIITEIKEEVSIDSQTEERETDSFGKIITRIKQKDSLINKYYEEDPVSILKIIDRLAFEKADKIPIEEIINQILEEKEKARQAITQDPLGQIFIAHEKETSTKILSEIEKVNSPTFKVGVEEVVVTGEDVNTKIHSHISQEIVEKNIFEKDLDRSSEIKIGSQPTTKTSFFSRLFSTRTPKNREKFDTGVPNTKGIESDMVFAPTEEEIRKTVIKKQNIKLIQKIKELAEKQAQEEPAEKDEKGRSLDVKKLLIYAELIAKIPQEYSESISPTHQEIIYLKKQEKGHKKTLNFLKELIQEEEKIIAEKKRIAKEITQIEKTVEEITKKIAKEIAEAKKLYLAEQERIDAEKIAETSVKKIRGDFEVLIKEAKKLTLEEQKIQIIRTLTTNSNSLIQAKTDIDKKVREILSSEYVDEKLVSVSGESTMEQLLVEAIIVDEAKKKLTPNEIKEIESGLKPKLTDSNSLEIDKKTLNLLIIKKALEKILTSEQKEMGLDEEINIDVTAINTVQNKLNFFKPDNQLNLDALALLESKEQSKALEERLTEINIELEKQSRALEERLAEINELQEKIDPPASELSSLNLENENASRVVEEPVQETSDYKPDNYRSYEKPPIMNEEDNSPQPDKILGAEEDFAKFRSEEESPLLPAESNRGLPSSENGDQLEHDLQVLEPEPKLVNPQQSRRKLGSSLKSSDDTLSTEERLFSLTASSVPQLPLDNIVPNTAPSTQLSTRTGKNEFWQTFISTRLRGKPSNSNQNSPRNKEDDSNQNQLDEPQSSSATSESESLEGSSTPRSISSYLTTEKGKTDETDEIEERKKRLYTILLANLEEQITKESGPESHDKINEKQNTTEFDSHSIDEEEIDVTTAENNIEFVMTQIATLTSNLASSISKNENKQTEGAPSSEASDPQTTQNSSTDDPIIYSGIGIRIKLEKEENGECSLKITEVFENSRLEKEDVNKKITHVECEGNLKSISAIYEECEGHEEKFYTKIALIFRDEKQEKLTLKIEGEEQERNVVKNIFIPEDKKGLNIYNNSQVKKIADKLRAPRETFRQLSTPRGRNA